MKVLLFLFLCLNLTSVLEAKTDTSLVGKSQLCAAVSYNNYDDTKILLELNKINPNQPCRTDGGATPLHIASQNRSYEAAELLLQYGADVNSRFDSGELWNTDIHEQTPLHFAVQNINSHILKHKDIIILLLKSGANPFLEDVSGNKPVDLLNSKSNKPDKQNVKEFYEINHLLKNPSLVMENDVADKYKYVFRLKKSENVIKSPFHIKKDKGKYKYIYYLNKPEKERLMACIEVDDDICLKGFLNKLSVNAQSYRREDSIIHIATRYKAMKILKFILKKGANVDALGSENYTALRLSISPSSRDMEIAKLLLDNGANPNNQNSYFGNTPLDEAVRHNLFDMVELLLSKGGNPNLKDYAGRTTVFSVKSEKVLKLLLKYRANINIKDNERKSALTKAWELGLIDTVYLLKEYGAKGHVDFISNKNILIQQIYNSSYIQESPLRKASSDLRKDKEIVLIALTKDAYALRYVDTTLKKDKEIVLVAVKKRGDSLQFADSSLKKDKEIVLAAVKQRGDSLQFADSSLKEDKEIVLAAVKQDGISLQYADSFLKRDKEIVLAAVRRNGKSLKYADRSFKKNKKVVLEAVKKRGNALQYADPSLRRDKEFVISVMYLDGYELQNNHFKIIDDSFKNDPDIILTAIKQTHNPRLFKHASPALKRNKKFVMSVLKHNVDIYEYIDDSLKNDKEMIIAGTKRMGKALKYASDSIRRDKDIVLAAVKQSGTALEYADSSLKNDKEIVLEAVKQNGYAIDYVGDSLKKDRDIVLAAVKQDPYILEIIDPSFRKDKEIVIAAIKESKFLYNLVDKSLKNDKDILFIINNK